MKPVTIVKIQHGAKYTFKYRSITEAARGLRVSPQCVWQAYYTQHKCRTFEIYMKPKKNFDITKFKTYEPI